MAADKTSKHDANKRQSPTWLGLVWAWEGSIDERKDCLHQQEGTGGLGEHAKCQGTRERKGQWDQAPKDRRAKPFGTKG